MHALMHTWSRAPSGMRLQAVLRVYRSERACFAHRAVATHHDRTCKAYDGQVGHVAANLVRQRSRVIGLMGSIRHALRPQPPPFFSDFVFPGARCIARLPPAGWPAATSQSNICKLARRLILLDLVRFWRVHIRVKFEVCHFALRVPANRPKRRLGVSESAAWLWHPACETTRHASGG